MLADIPWPTFGRFSAYSGERGETASSLKRRRGRYKERMATHRPSVPESTKRALRDQAGGKCANPGCSATRTHLHHIREWAVYQSHDGRHMVAICPMCHDAVHSGPLTISDKTLYRWKTISRSAAAERGHLYVEPGRQAKLLLGSVAVTGDAGLLVFELSAGSSLSFALKDEDIMLLSLALADRHGRVLVRLTDGYVAVEPGTDLEYSHVPGRHVITAPFTRRYMPMWALERIQKTESGYRPDDRVTLLDLEVVEPGVVRVAGIWLESRHGVVVTESMLHFVRVDPVMLGSLAIAGAGAGSVLHYTGPITAALFGFGSGAEALNVGGRRRSSILDRRE